MRVGGWLAIALSVTAVAACGSSSDGSSSGGGAPGSAGAQGSLAGADAGGGPASAGASNGSSGATSQAGSASAGAPATGGGSGSAEWACINSGGVCDCQVPFVPQPAGTPNTCAEAKYDCCYYVHPVGINERCRCLPLQQGSGTCADIAAAIGGNVQDHCPP